MMFLPTIKPPILIGPNGLYSKLDRRPTQDWKLYFSGLIGQVLRKGIAVITQSYPLRSHRTRKQHEQDCFKLYSVFTIMH